MAGLDGRCNLLIQLGSALQARKDICPNGRPGDMLGKPKSATRRDQANAQPTSSHSCRKGPTLYPSACSGRPCSNCSSPSGPHVLLFHQNRLILLAMSGPVRLSTEPSQSQAKNDKRATTSSRSTNCRSGYAIPSWRRLRAQPAGKSTVVPGRLACQR